MTCKLKGCKKEIRWYFGATYCSKEHQYIDSHRYVGETLQQYKERKRSKKLKSAIINVTKNI